MKPILVIGREGQLARSLSAEAAQRGVAMQHSDRSLLDLSAPESLKAALDTLDPAAIINAAAYTAVDQAEGEEDLATRINGVSPGVIASFAKERAIPFLHVSTDYVFDGDKQGPYTEEDQTNPTGAYGRSKLAGEEAVMASNPDAMIFRTAWVYSPYGKNFLLTMLKVGETRDLLTVVHDQVGNPTYAPDLAAALLDVCDQVLNAESLAPYAGIYHMAGTGSTHWAGFADAIFDAGEPYGHPRPKVQGIPSSDYPTPTKRPANSQLDGHKLAARFGVRLPHWQDSVRTCVAEVYKTRDTEAS